MRTLAASWLTSFRPFTTFHLVVAFACITAAIVACRIGIRTRRTRFEPWFRRCWTAFIVTVEIIAYWWWTRPEHFDWGWTLPLHLCSIVVWIAPIALLGPWRIPQALLYFLGLGLCFQGLVSPLRQDGLTAAPFWFFWLNHLAICGSAVYLVAVLGFRPTGRDFLTALVAGLSYIALVLPLNIAFGWNYGAMGRDLPGTQGVVGKLGPWPWRIGPMFLIALALGLLLWGIWTIPRLWRSRPAPTQQPA